jgi:geranylgeranyl diphosphate synthase type II
MTTFNLCLDEFNEIVSKKLFISQEPRSLYEPIDYILSLGGKRVRPASLMAICDFYSGSRVNAINAALAIEIFHNFTLLHDDIMDNASLRRGQKTVHEAFNTNTAILSGDVMFVKSIEYFTHYSADILVPVLKVFNQTAIEVCEGQSLDMDFELRDNVNITEYIKMIGFKTSVLLAACLQIGGIIGGASKEDQLHLYEFGKNLGIAFQIQDDILDTYGEQVNVGKRACGDILQNKKTYLYLKAIELADLKLKNELLSWYEEVVPSEREEEKINAVKKIFNTLVVQEWANQLKEAYKDLAISHIEPLNLKEHQKEELRSFADYLIERSF